MPEVLFMRPSDLPETQRKNFARLLEEEIRNEQEEESVNPDKAFLRVALNTLGFDRNDGYYTDGAFDYGLDFVHVTEEEASIFQAKSLAIDGGIPLEQRLTQATSPTLGGLSRWSST
jgi:hypothetical protein